MNKKHKTSNSHSIKSILWNEKLFTNDIDIAEIFNNYFANIATELDECLPTNNVDPLSYVSRHVNSSTSFHFTDPNESSTIIKNLKITNQDKDAVLVRLLISNCDFLSIIISDMINCSISKCVFPYLLKFAIVTPIFKKGDRQIISNYRPISVLPILGKIFENIIHARLSKFLSENSVITHLQFGFSKNVSIFDVIINLPELIYDILIKK